MADTVTSVLNAVTLFGRLGLADNSVDPGTVRRQYRNLALRVHPDKCKELRAKEAFQLLSEAFEKLSTQAGQAAYLQQVQKSGVQTGARSRWARRARPSDERARWWDTATWEEFEKRLRHRDRAEAALRKQFEGRVLAKATTRKLRGQVRAAERSVEHCDRGAGLAESELWPPESRQAARDAEQEWKAARDKPGVMPGLEPEMPDFNERPELDNPELAMCRLLDLMTHLRTVHLYCLHCGCRYDSSDDLDRNCPGITEEEHESAAAAFYGMRTSEETAVASAGTTHAKDGEEDSLDAYMKQVNAALGKEDSSRQKKRRRQ